jgi:hypothetical protein
MSKILYITPLVVKGWAGGVGWVLRGALLVLNFSGKLVRSRSTISIYGSYKRSESSSIVINNHIDDSTSVTLIIE